MARSPEESTVAAADQGWGACAHVPIPVAKTARWITLCTSLEQHLKSMRHFGMQHDRQTGMPRVHNSA